MAHLEDWIVLDDGKPIGRIYQRHAPANADVVVLVGHGLRRAAVRAAHKRYGGNTRRREGGLSGQLRQMARLGNEGRIQLWPRLTLFSVRAAPGRRGLEMSRRKGRRAKSTVVKHSVSIAGRNTSVSLENAFWQSLKEIASEHDMIRTRR